MPAAGDRFDRYVVDRVLGRGGLATVYLVHHETLGSPHALKVLDVPLPAVRARLVQEGRIQARLSHPNIVAVTDLLDVEGSPGLIMEYIAGPTLDGLLRDQVLDADTLESIFRGILDGVSFAHRQGLVHRDLKPSNVLMASIDGRWVPKVTDFGLAKLVGADVGSSHTRTGSAMGTPGYMAPEQVRSAKDVDARADVFALTCILYDLWCGQPPFPGDDPFATLLVMEASGYPPPRSMREDLPPRVEAAILGGLEPDRARRLPSCESLRAVLDGGEVPLELDEPSPPSGPAAMPSRFTFPEGSPPLSPATFQGSMSDEAYPPPRSPLPKVLGVLVGAAACALLCAGVSIWGWTMVQPAGTAAPEVAAPPPAAVGAAARVTPPVSTGTTTGTTTGATPATSAPAASPAPAPAVEPSGAPSAPLQAVPTTTPPEVSSAAPAHPASSALAPSSAQAAAEGVARFELQGDVDRAWLETRGQRIGPGQILPGSYTLHARWGEIEVERAVTVGAGQVVTARCDRAFANCTVTTR